MAIASGAQASVAYITEVTWGTTPGTPQLTLVPTISSGFNLVRDTYTDNSRLPDRQTRALTVGNTHVEGQIECAFSATNYNVFLESVMNSTWSTNVLKVGNTRKSFTIEEGFADIAQYQPHLGCFVDKMTVKVPVDGLVTATFDFIGKSQSVFAGTSIDSSAGYTAAAAETPFYHTAASGHIKEGGSAIAYLTSIELSINNNSKKNWALGSNTMRDTTLGTIAIEGTATAYFEDAVIYNKFVNNTATSIDFKLHDGTAGLQFYLPNIRYTAATISPANDGPVLITMPFTALYNTGDTSTLVITKS